MITILKIKISAIIFLIKLFLIFEIIRFIQSAIPVSARQGGRQPLGLFISAFPGNLHKLLKILYHIIKKIAREKSESEREKTGVLFIFT